MVQKRLRLTKATPLKQRLTENGCSLERDEFRELVATTFKEFLKAKSLEWTDEELLFHPRVSLEFCNEVCRRSGCPKLDDDLILRTLVNTRKSP